MAIKKPTPVPDAPIKVKKVWGTAHFTLNLGEHESLKIEIGEECEVVRDGHKEAVAYLSRCLREAGTEAIKEILRDIPIVEKGLKPAGDVAVHFKNEVRSEHGDHN